MNTHFYKVRFLLAFFLILLVIVLFVNFFVWVTSNFVVDGAVDIQNGLVSVYTHADQLITYDKKGNLLYQINLPNPTGGSAALSYDSRGVNVYLFRTDDLYIYNQKGERIQELNYTYEENKKALKSWEDWERNSSGFRMETEEVIFQYNYPNFWRFLFGDRNVSLEVIDKVSQKSIVLLDLEQYCKERE